MDVDESSCQILELKLCFVHMQNILVNALCAGPYVTTKHEHILTNKHIKHELVILLMHTPTIIATYNYNSLAR